MSFIGLEPPLEIIEVLNAVRLGREPKPTKTGFYMRFRTKMDEKVCPICAPLNGKVWNLAEFNEAVIPWVDTHPRCRCVLEYEEWTVVNLLDSPGTTVIQTK